MHDHGPVLTSEYSPNPPEVSVLSRGLSILRAFAPRNGWLSNHQIADAVGLPRPTVSRITANLTSLGYLEYAAAQGQYRLGTAALALGYGAFSSLDVWTVARPYLCALARDTDALAVLSLRDGMHMVCNEVFHGEHILTLRLNAGSRMQLPHSTMGHALVGKLAGSERQALLDEVRERFPDEWATLEPALEDAARQVQRRGFCATLGTAERGVNGVGCVLDLRNAPTTYVLGCAAPALRFPPERLENEIGPRLMQIKASIERQLGETVGAESAGAGALE
jgi:IclR family transcriptional regulator, positive regulator for flagellar biogenesis